MRAMNSTTSPIQHLEQRLAAVDRAIDHATAELGRAALAQATGAPAAAGADDLDAELNSLVAQRRRLEAALAAAQVQAQETSHAELEARLGQAKAGALDVAEQVKHAHALDKALRAALQAAKALHVAGQTRRQHVVDAGRTLAQLVPGTRGLEAAAMAAHLVDSSAATRSAAVPLLIEIAKDLGLRLDLSMAGVDTKRSPAELIAEDNQVLAQRLSTWVPEIAQRVQDAIRAEQEGAPQ